MAKKKKKSNKSNKYLLLLIAAVLVISTLFVSLGGFGGGDISTSNKANGLQEQKGKDKQNTDSDDAKYLEMLKEDGYTQEQIDGARTTVERLMFQLQEITSAIGSVPGVPSVEAGEKEDDTAAYAELSDKIAVGKAVYLMLKLQKDFSTQQAVLDEYLLSLQLGIDLETYLEDPEAYQKQKDEKSLGVDPQSIIQVSNIESKMIEKIQEQNERNKAKEPDAGTNLPGKGNTGQNKPGVDLPEVPNADSIRPKDPLEEVMKDINGGLQNPGGFGR